MVVLLMIYFQANRLKFQQDYFPSSRYIDALRFGTYLLNIIIFG